MLLVDTQIFHFRAVDTTNMAVAETSEYRFTWSRND